MSARVEKETEKSLILEEPSVERIIRSKIRCVVFKARKSRAKNGSSVEKFSCLK